MQIEVNEIHIWAADLTLSAPQLKHSIALLSPDECERANRFHFPIHRQRFIAARSMLRTLISLYTAVKPEDVIFSYNENKKPFLEAPQYNQLQFNLSHSDNMAVYAFTVKHAVGIDIEKMEEDYNQNVAQRFFSQTEKDALLQLPKSERMAGFYRIWARKEALIKATGKGLSTLLSTFSVSVNDAFEVVMLDNKESWSLLTIAIHPAYQSAVATNQMIKRVSYWKLIEQSPTLDRVYDL